MKKWLALVVAALLALSTFAAFAVDSPKPEATIDADSIKSTTDAEIEEDFIVAVPEEEPEQLAEMTEKAEEVIKGGDPIVELFDEDVQKAIEEKLPEETDLETLEMNELIPLIVENYEEEYGDVEVVIHFPTDYNEDQDLVAMLGCFTEANVDEEAGKDGYEWFALEAEALEDEVKEDGTVEDGGVKITFTQDALEAAEAADARLLGILSTPAETK